MISDNDKVLIITPHADDECLGLGGTIDKWVQQDTGIKIVLVTTSDRAREKEFKAAMRVLGVIDYQILYPGQELSLDMLPMKDIVTDLDSVLYDYLPSIILYPYSSYHQDHQVVSKAMYAALRPSPSLYGFVKFIGLYEYPYVVWSRSPLPESRFYIDIKDNLKTKLKALRCYKSQLQKSPREMISIATIRSWAETRGREVGLEVAEVIYPLRGLL